MKKKTVTFRQQTMGSITDFIADEGLVCQESQNLLSALVGALFSYRHEGTDFSPTILFCTGSDEVFKSFPGTVEHEIASAPLGASAVHRILKDCAPLAVRSWGIFIERTADRQARYGVFSYPRNPTALPLHEAIAVVTGATCILLQKSATNSIRLRGSSGNELSLNFSTTREDAESVVDPVEQFAADCCRDLKNATHAADFQDYFTRTLAECLAACHGAILACAIGPDLDSVSEFRDGIVIAPHLDFLSAYEAYRSDASAESILRMQSAEELFGGVLQSDGIVVLDTKARLLAYRVFYRPALTEFGPNVPVGGARRRAFEGAKAMVGTALASLLFRSQDGLTIREGVD